MSWLFFPLSSSHSFCLCWTQVCVTCELNQLSSSWLVVYLVGLSFPGGQQDRMQLLNGNRFNLINNLCSSWPRGHVSLRSTPMLFVWICHLFSLTLASDMSKVLSISETIHRDMTSHAQCRVCFCMLKFDLGVFPFIRGVGKCCRSFMKGPRRLQVFMLAH